MQPIVLWNEGALRRKCRQWICPHDHRDSSQCSWYDEMAEFYPWGWWIRLWRPWIQWGGKREEIRNARHLSIIEFRTNKCPKNIKVPDTYKGINWDKQQGNRKASTRCKVEHPFLIVKSSSVVPGPYDKVYPKTWTCFISRLPALIWSCVSGQAQQEFCMV